MPFAISILFLEIILSSLLNTNLISLLTILNRLNKLAPNLGTNKTFSNFTGTLVLVNIIEISPILLALIALFKLP